MKRLLFSFLLLLPFFINAQVLRVAVAANAAQVVKALQTDFKKRTGIAMELIPGSSGKLAEQIKNGAPYDVFLSADMEYPEALYKEGFAVARPQVYALGSLIVCSTIYAELKNWKKLVLNTNAGKIAIANPAVAPYGKAATEALKYYKLWDKCASNLVLGESIAQVNTYISTGTVSLGFTTEALVFDYPDKGKLKWERVDPRSYNEIRQGMVLLSHANGANQAAARKFVDYLTSTVAKNIFKKFGYRLP